MKTIALILLALALVAGSFAVTYRLGIGSSSWLAKDAVFCGDARSLDEAQAAESDKDWLASIPSCHKAAENYRVRPLGCGWRSCQVRVWDEYGHTGLAYASARSLSH